LGEVGIRAMYEGLVFDRSVRGKDAVQRVVGVGHKIVEQALQQALGDWVCVAGVSSTVLPGPLVVARVIDRVTGRDSPVRSVVVAAEKSNETGEWLVLRDWQAVRRLNELARNVGVLRRSCAPPKDRLPVSGALEAALRTIEGEVASLKTGFRVPAVEAVAVLWPSAEIDGPKDEQTVGGVDGMNDLLE